MRKEEGFYMNRKTLVMLGLCLAIAGAASVVMGGDGADKVKNRAKEAAEKAKDRARDASEKKKEATEKKQEKQKEWSEKRDTRVEKRQDNQEKRIEHGIKKGALTQDEIDKLNKQQDEIEKMQQSFKSNDGKITKDEMKSLQNALNEASRSIWTEKHDTEGKQLPVYRLGKDVKLNQELADKLSSGTLSKGEADQLMKDFRNTLNMKKKLNGDLSDSEREATQKSFNEMLGKYFSTSK